MFIRQNQSAPVQSTAIIDQTVVRCCKHIDIYLRYIQMLQLYYTFVCLIKIGAFSNRNLIPSCPLILLAFFIPQMVSRANFRKILHPFCTQLNFNITAGTSNQYSPLNYRLCCLESLSCPYSANTFSILI